ncbi:MAG: TorF family putative porin [Rhodanobacter sp.]
MKRCTTLVFCAGALLFASLAMPAKATDAPQSTTSGSVAVVNDYLFRGLSQTDREPAVQAGIEYDHSSGWYVGGWGSNISWLSDASTPAAPISSSLEVDVYAGHRGSLGGDWTYDAGLYEYYYPGTYPNGFIRPYTLEGYASLGWKSLSLKYSHTFTNLFGFADSKHSDYLDLSWNYEFSPGWTFNTHVGHQTVKNNPGLSYSDWKVGVTRSFDHGYSIALGYYGTSAPRSGYTNTVGQHHHYLGRATGILTLTKTL